MASQALPVLDPKKVAEFQQSVPQIVEQAKDLEVKNNDDLAASSAMLDVIIARKDNITKFFEEPAKQANNVHKFITSLRAALLQPLTQAEDLLKERRKDYRAELERERLRLEEQERLAAKQQQDEVAIEEAAQLEAIGETAAADAVLQQAAAAPPPSVFVPSLVPKEQGKSLRKVFKFRVVNEANIKREFMMPDETKIQAIVSRLGQDAVAIIGGIEVVEDETEVIRRKK